MKIVIDTPERLWTKQLTSDDYIEIVNAVANGSPLPKHHGRLIDEKVIYNRIRPLVNNGQLDDIMLDIDYVLEADKEVQDEADSD